MPLFHSELIGHMLVEPCNGTDVRFSMPPEPGYLKGESEVVTRHDLERLRDLIDEALS